MKFSVAVAALATVASASIVERDGATVNNVLSQVGDGISKLDTSAKAYNGNKQPLVDASNSLLSTIKSGTSTVSGTSKLSQTDALGLVSPVQALTKTSQTLVDDLKAKRSAIEKAGDCATVRSTVSEINTDSQALIKAVVSKVPTELQSTAATLSAGLTKVLQQAQDDFSEANCKDASGGGSSSAAPTSSGMASSEPASSGMASATGDVSTVATTVATTTVCPTGGATGTGVMPGSPTTSGPVQVTAGAAAFAPAGALAMAVAALVL